MTPWTTQDNDMGRDIYMIMLVKTIQQLQPSESRNRS